MDETLLQARGLEMPGRTSMVFGPVDMELPRGQLGVVTGQQGSGRSALLLALAGRLKGVQGELTVGEIDGIAHPRKLRREVSVARITGLADLEPNLTIGESRDERAIAEGIGVRRGRERFVHLERELGHRFDPEQWVDRMPAVERTLLTLVLGCLAPSRYVVLDDIDESLTDRQLGWIHDGLDILLEGGQHVVMSALDQSPLPAKAVVWHLDKPTPPQDAGFELHLPRHAQDQASPTRPIPTRPPDTTPDTPDAPTDTTDPTDTTKDA